MIWDVRSGSRIRIFPYPGFRIWIQGPKKHRIPDPDPQHWFLFCGHTWGLWLHWTAHYGKYTKDSSVIRIAFAQQKFRLGYHYQNSIYIGTPQKIVNTKPLWNRDDRELMHETSGLVHREVRRNFVSNRVVDSWNQLPVPSEVKIARKVGMLRWL